MNAEQLSNLLNEAMASDEWGALDAWVTANASFVYKDPSSVAATAPWPPEMHAVVLGALSTPAVLRSDGAVSILSLLQYDWGLVDLERHEDLANAIEAAYPALAAPTPLLLAAELLGGYLGSAGAEALLRLVTVKDETARSLVPSGLVEVVRQCDPSRAKRALKALSTLANDPSPLVVREAMMGLSKVSDTQAFGLLGFE